eukprot:m.36829 g.36829  ORF g.36829 m.36829 type:complete len:98 (+) comp5800_c1_seq1:69-362(+)
MAGLGQVRTGSTGSAGHLQPTLREFVVVLFPPLGTTAGGSHGCSATPREEKGQSSTVLYLQAAARHTEHTALHSRSPLLCLCTVRTSHCIEYAARCP